MFKREVVFLGRVVSEKGYNLDPSTITPVLQLKESPPKTGKQSSKANGIFELLP